MLYTGKESVAVYVCPSCGEAFAPAAGSLMPRPCPRCLRSAGRVVEMLPNEPKPPDPPPPEET